jgi:hypothetical protein
MPLRQPPGRPRLRARNALLVDPEFARVDRIHYESPLEVEKVVRGGKRAAIVVAATAATIGGTLVGVNQALDEISGTIERVERIYEQIRDFGEEDRFQQEETRVLSGRRTEPAITAQEIRLRRLEGP